MLSSIFAPGNATSPALDAALGKLLVIQSSRSTFLAPVASGSATDAAAGAAAGAAAALAAEGG